MIIGVIVSIIIAAIVCLGLSQRVSTRLLGIVAALTLFGSAIALLVDWMYHPVDLSPAPIVWAVLDQTVVSLSFDLAPEHYVLALLVPGGGSLAVLMLALSLDPVVRGFGALFAWALLAVASALLGVISTGVLLPVSWSLTTLACYSAVRSSGALAQYEPPHYGVALGLLASVLLLVAMLPANSLQTAEMMPESLAVAGILLAVLMLTGGAPFHNALDEIVEAPAALSGLLYGVVLPVLGGGTLWLVSVRVNPLPGTMSLVDSAAWQSMLLVAGALSAVICSAAALREHSMRRLLAWLTCSQFGIFLVAVGIGTPMSRLVALALLVNSVCTTLAGTLATTILEHATGSDDFTQELSGNEGVRYALRIPGLIWILGAVSALGIPPLWGFWARYWMIHDLLEYASWTVPLILAASSMAALAYLAPLACFWWPGTDPRRAVARRAAGPGSGLLLQDNKARSDTGSLRVQTGGLRVHDAVSRTTLPYYLSPLTYAFMPSLAIVPLALLGIAPHLAWEKWLRHMPGAPAAVPIPGMLAASSSVLLLAFVVLTIILWRIGWRRHTLPDEDMVPVVLAPDTLAEQLAPMVWVGAPWSLMKTLGNGLELLTRGVHFALALFEERYYLAGVLLALISLVVIMAQW